MDPNYRGKQDEYDLDFDDTAPHAVLRWEEICQAVIEGISSPADRDMIHRYSSWTDVATDIQTKSADKQYNVSIRRMLRQVETVPRSLGNLTNSFLQAIEPNKVDLRIIWGLILLNIKLAVVSHDKLSRTTDWLVRLRRVVERFHRCYESCDPGKDKDEATITIIDLFDHMLAIMSDSAKFLRRPINEQDASKAWASLTAKIAIHQKELDETTRHLTEIKNYSAANQKQAVDYIVKRHALDPESEEKAKFPLCMLPYQSNAKFFGRAEELSKLDKYLAPKEKPSLRTFTIYGRRGVGKTEIALRYAYLNPTNFDAIFWIGCETSLTLRSSFTNTAKKLMLPSADAPGRDEENQLAVQEWLKRTKKTWLLIFDNAEKDSEEIMKGYWPIGANGAILITSRTYHNFLKDSNRKGETVQMFNADESWNLMLRLLGDEWVTAYKNGKIKQADELAAKSWLKLLGGLPLSIKTAATLITDPNKGADWGIVEAFDRFKQRHAALPPRPRGERSEYIATLDALFDMIFDSIGKQARDFLSVLALLSPDEILIELFLPRKQSALDGKLSFAKQEKVVLTVQKEATFASIISIPPALSKVLEELKAAELIRWERHRIIAVHRVVQEAMNYHSKLDLQQSFDAAVHLVHQAFPNQVDGGTLYDEWPVCASYITHAIHLTKKFGEYQVPESESVIVPSEEFLELTANASWYLYEVGDFDLSRRAINVGKNACENKESYIYSHFCNTQACSYYELTRLADGRRNMEEALRIREALLDPNSNDIAICLHNMGNMEHAAGNYDEALSFYNRAAQIRHAIGNSAAFLLGSTYLGIGRCHQGKEEFGEARKAYSKAEQLFIRTVKSDGAFMAHLHYAYGNLEFDEKNYTSARRAFELCLTIATDKTPIHPITAAAYYSLGSVELHLGKDEQAKGYLAKARSIAELRSPTRDDGTVARILWKTAQALKYHVSGAGNEEARQLLERAYAARDALNASGEAVDVPFNDDEERPEIENEEETFDQLVPGYFR